MCESNTGGCCLGIEHEHKALLIHHTRFFPPLSMTLPLFLSRHIPGAFSHWPMITHHGDVLTGADSPIDRSCATLLSRPGPASCIRHPASCVLCPVSCALRPVSCALRPVFCTLRPVSCALRPCVLHPASCTRRPPQPAPADGRGSITEWLQRKLSQHRQHSQEDLAQFAFDPASSSDVSPGDGDRVGQGRGKGRGSLNTGGAVPWS